MVSRTDQNEVAVSSGVVLTSDGVRRGMVRLLPIAAFSVPFGMAFGVAAIEAGMTPTQAIVMSALTFSGSAQFATLDFLEPPIAYVSIAFVVLALNARHVIMGAVLSVWVNRLPATKRTLTLAFLSDPNFADSQPAFRDGEQDIGVLLGGGLSLWIGWVMGTVIGAAGGAFLDDPEAYGIDVVMACFFATVVIGQLRRDFSLFAPILAASLVSVATLTMLPTGWNVMLGALVGGILSVFPRGV